MGAKPNTAVTTCGAAGFSQSRISVTFGASGLVVIELLIYIKTEIRVTNCIADRVSDRPVWLFVRNFSRTPRFLPKNMVLLIESKSPFEVSEVLRDMQRAFVKCINVLEAARDDCEAHFGNGGCREARCEGSGNSQAHFKNVTNIGETRRNSTLGEGIPKHCKFIGGEGVESEAFKYRKDSGDHTVQQRMNLLKSQLRRRTRSSLGVSD